jgi:hypothetical protein
MTTATEVGYLEMRIAKVVGIREAEDEPFHQYVVRRRWPATEILPSRSGGRRTSAWRLAWVGSPGGAR